MEEIRRVGWQVGWCRYRLWILPSIVFACYWVAFGFLESSAASGVFGGSAVSSFMSLFQVGIMGWLPSAGVWLLVGLLVAECWLWARKLIFIRRLGAFPPELRTEMLLTVQQEGEEAGQLAERILRDLGLPTELTPAGTPEGSGAEVSVVEHSRHPGLPS